MDQSNLHRPLLDPQWISQFRFDVLRYLGRKGDNLLGSCFEVQPTDFSILVVDNFVFAGQKRIGWEKVPREQRLLVVARYRITHPAVVPGLQIAQLQTGFSLVTAGV